MRSDYIAPDTMQTLLDHLQPANALVCRVALKTGLRVGDCVSIEKSAVRERFTVVEQKTGHHRRVWIGKRLLADLRQFSGHNGSRYIFPNRIDPKRHRTRQAVFMDIRKQCDKLGIPGVVTPHSFRKAYAVGYYRRTGSLEKTQRRMGHKKLETTLLYALSDKL